MKNCLLTAVLILLAFSCHAKDSKKPYGRHIVSVSAQANNTGPGFGIQYENMRPNDKFSFTAPVYFCFSHVEKDKSHGADGRGRDQYPLMLFVSPGFRFYPTRSSGVGRYSIGANVFVGFGKGASHYWVNGTNQLQSRSVVGASIANGINFQITRHIRTGLELSLGIFEDNGADARTGKDANTFGQLVFNLGYRF